MYVEIYGTKNCKYCTAAKDLVENTPGATYSYTDVTDLEERANLNLRLGFQARSVPQIFVDNEYVKLGYYGLEKLINPISILAKAFTR